MASTPPFVLQRATAEDMLEMVKLQYLCFPQVICETMMGCNSEAELPRLRDEYVQFMQESPSDIWIIVKDIESGQIIAGSNWKVYLNRAAALKGHDEPPAWLEGSELESSKFILHKMNDMRARIMQDGFIHLHICYTHPDFRRRNAGGMMLKWGCDLADHFMLPAYIEASTEGNFLYKTFGFYDHEKIEWGQGADAVVMLRDARQGGIAGGKAKPVK